jgi:cytochrome c oxidase cbb3-type subunit I/II
VVENLKAAGMTVLPDREIVALIAYMQRLGTDLKNEKGSGPSARKE